MQSKGSSMSEQWQTTLTAISTTRLLLTASFLTEPRVIPLDPSKAIDCSELSQALRIAFAGVPPPGHV
jgi:hypothetical protein